MNKKWKYTISLLSLVAGVIWLAVFSLPDKNFHLIACSIGEGDAILAIYKKTQILVDGGPGNKVMECLSKHMPFWDREIEAVILTHPDSDHFTGLIEVFKNYKVDNFIANALDTSDQTYGVLKSLVGGSGAKIINPTSGLVLRYDLIQLDILHPSKEFLEENLIKKSTPTAEVNSSDSGVLGAYTSSLDTNEFSIVGILSFGDFDALLTGDIDNKISDAVAEGLVVSGSRTMEYIKIPHHGSKNGITEELINVTEPSIAVISVGKNSYGHPNEEILKILKDKNIKILRTDEMGDVAVESDGKKMWTVNLP